MNMDKLPLEQATDEQIRTFARTFLQLDGADAKEIKKVRADVTAAWPQGFIWIAKTVEALQLVAGTAVQQLSKSEIEERAGPGIAASSSKNDPMVLLTIHKMAGPGGADPVFANVNGSAMHVARGLKQLVPWRYYHDLCNTVQRIYDWNERTGVTTSEDVLRFPLTVHTMPSEDEIFEFDRLDAARTGQKLTREYWEHVRAMRATNDANENEKAERERRAG